MRKIVAVGCNKPEVKLVKRVRFEDEFQIKGSSQTKVPKCPAENENKTLGIDLKQFTRSYRDKLTDSFPELAEIDPGEGYQADKYIYGDEFVVFVNHSSDGEQVKSIETKCTDPKSFEKIENILFDIVYPELPESKRAMLNKELLEFGNTEVNPAPQGNTYVKSWSEKEHDGKYLSVIQLILKSKDEKKLYSRLQLRIWPAFINKSATRQPPPIKE